MRTTGSRLGGAALALALAACAAPSAPQETSPAPQRVVSLDYCADQFVLKLADRTQIAAVSTDATRDFSYMREVARGVRQVRARGEEALALRPDLVIRSYGGEANVSALMRRAGVRVAQIGFAEDLEGVRRTIRDMAQALGHPERGEALIADLDARLAAAASTRPDAPTALYVTPGGVTTGEGSLVHELLRAAGLANFEGAPGWRPIPLERLARERPDLIAAGDFGRSRPPDPWSTARHPVARRQLRERPTAVLDGAWTSCGGWFVVEAVETLAHARDALEAAE